MRLVGEQTNKINEKDNENKFIKKIFRSNL